MLDNTGRVIYIGKAKNLRSRLLSYFRVNSRDPKAGRIIQHTRVLLWEQTADEFSALLRELELIQRFGPRFNVLGRLGVQRYHYLCVGRPPAAYAYLTKAPTGKELGCYGPLVNWSRSEDVARRLNDWYGLRDCPQTVPLMFADQPELFPNDRTAKCLRYEIGTCRGPCVGACTRQDYVASVRGMKAFLDGRDRRLLQTFTQKMEEASAAFQFEKATAFRDRLQSIEWIDDRLSLLRRARNQNSCVYPLTGADGKERWYLIYRGQVRAVVPTPTTDAERSRTAAVLQRTLDDSATALVLNEGAVDSVLLVAAWFRKYPDERAKLLTRAKAFSLCAATS